MKKILLISLLLISIISLYGQQQWNGDLNSTSNIWRTGKVGIGSHFSSGLGYLLQVSSNNSDKGILGFHISGNNSVMTSYAGISENSNIIFRTSTLGNVSEKMIINHNGKVGIGSHFNSELGYLLQISSNSSDKGILGIHISGNNSVMTSYAGISENSNIIFRTSTLGNASEKMIINHNGNVGIGTTETGTHKLAVEGTIGAREIKVEAPPSWSDFVFNEDYELKDLEEVESFIEKNNHLPDVPSEKEVLENGIQLGEMDAKLLQKIEELTLYMIEQNKKTKELIEKVETLESINKELQEKMLKLETTE